MPVVPNGSKCSFEEAERFSPIIGVPTAPNCFQTFDDSPRKDPSLARTLHGSVKSLWPELCGLNSRGAGIFVAVNVVEFEKRRMTENVLRVRACFADNDNPLAQGRIEAEIARLGLPPSVIVQSSPGKRHYYWLVHDCPLHCFTPMQRAIAAALGTDPAVCDLPRVMRLPGFLHQKAEPFLAHVVACP